MVFFRIIVASVIIFILVPLCTVNLKGEHTHYQKAHEIQI